MDWRFLEKWIPAYIIQLYRHSVLVLLETRSQPPKCGCFSDLNFTTSELLGENYYKASVRS